MIQSFPENPISSRYDQGLDLLVLFEDGAKGEKNYEVAKMLYVSHNFAISMHARPRIPESMDLLRIPALLGTHSWFAIYLVCVVCLVWILQQ